MHYNQAVHKTAREEMLLNLVRMKYRDSIEFVKIPSITGQHTYAGGIGLSFPFTPAPGSGSTDIAAQSKPTIVYQPEQAQEFNQRLLSRIGPETLDLLTSKGWAANRVLRLTVRSINDVDNATSAGGPTPKLKPDFERFRHVAYQLRALQIHRQVEMGYESMTVDDPVQVSDPIQARHVTGEATLLAAEKGYRFRRGRDGTFTLWTAPKSTTQLVLRVAPEAVHSTEMREIAEHLELEPGQASYRLILDKFGQLKKPSATRLGHTVPLDEYRNELNVSTRSIKEMMFYLSHGIDVPHSHVAKELVTQTRDADGREFDWHCMTHDLLKVQVSRLPPTDVAVSVFYRGHWFYIQDSDKNSKSTFNLLIELFNLKIRAGGGAQIPLLSI